MPAGEDRRRAEQGDALTTRLLDAGVVVARPDFEGVGVPGGHPYLMGASLGESMARMAEATAEGITYVVGRGTMLEGMDDALEGASVGEERSFTTTLAGGEFNNQAGCTDLRVQIKHGYRHADLMPRTVVLDPAPSVHAPLRVWLSTGMRAVDHAVEGICSQFAHPGGDASFIHALKLLSRGLRAVKREPGNLEARLDCAMGVWLSMAGRQGRAQMGASHALGHVLGGSYEVPQGDASSIVLPHVLRFNRAVNAAQQRRVAEAMGCPNEDAADVVAALARDIALSTGGQSYDLTNVSRLTEDFQPTPRHESSIQIRPLWNNWLATTSWTSERKP